MTPYKFLVGFVLAVAMITVLTLAALVFSARDFQYGVQQVAPASNGLIAIDRLLLVDRDVVKLETDSAGPRGDLLVIEQQIADIDNANATTAAAVNNARTTIVGGIAEIETRAGAGGAESAAANVETAALNARVQTLASRSGLSPTDQQAVANLRNQVNQLAAQEEQADDRAVDRAQLVTQQQLLSGQVNESNRRIYALQQSVVPDFEHYERFRGEAYALKYLSPIGVSAYLAQGHPALLSTALVLLMGALGALLYLFPAYLNRAVPVTMAEIAVRLIFGMCAALAFYVLANATVAGFSIAASVSQASTASTLNPFTVSLIGIIAGVLSEDIAKWIQDRGRGIFTQGQISSGATASSQAAAETYSGVNPHGGPDTP